MDNESTRMYAMCVDIFSCSTAMWLIVCFSGDPPHKPHPKCGKDSIKCETSNKCYREHQRCDGHVNCPMDGSDEDDCDGK